MEIFFQPPNEAAHEGKAPDRLGGGDPGLGGDCEDWALRNSLKLSVASSITSPPTRRLRHPCRREGNGTTTQPQTLVNCSHGEHADLAQLFVSKIGVFFSAGRFRAAEAGLVRDAPQFLFGNSQQHRCAPCGHKLQGFLQLVMFFVDRVASHHSPFYAESKTMESCSTVMIIDL
jgi:hypothetical protein